MKTMKKFWKYFLNFIVLFLLVSGLMYLGTRNIKKREENTTITYSTQTTSPIIEITECKNGKLKGTIKNDTSILINIIYVKAEFYDKNEKLLETKYYEIKYFNVGERAKFEIEFSSKNVTNVKVTSVESKR